MKKKKKGAAEGDKVKGKQAAKASHKVKGKLWDSWMSGERSFQIKTLYSYHRYTRNYNMGSLVTFRWIARHYGRDIILNSAISYKFIREDIREKYMVDVSLGQCKRAKQCALYEHDGRLIEHYGKPWDYQQAVLDSNPDEEAYASTIEQDFTSKTREIKALDEEAYAFLIEREPTTWCKAYFQKATRCDSFENGISESFNAQILSARGKPIITMLEDIRVYIIPRIWHMSKQASECDDIITPSIRKHLEELKEKQRKWTIFPSGYQVVEVRKMDEAFGVNLITRKCDCRLWNLS
nr:hypothetical protein CTI12_AA081420 [Tanacetum cinerariifolium]